jgi:hypothetical protein
MVQGFLIYFQVLHVHESGIHGYIQNGVHVTVIIHGVAFLNSEMDISNAASGKQTKHCAEWQWVRKLHYWVKFVG